MINNIPFKGVTHDSTSTDGELSLCLNLVNDNGTLTPLEKPKHIATLPNGFNALYLHETATYKHLIGTIATGENVFNLVSVPYDSIGSVTPSVITEGITEIPTINSIGNTLIIIYKNNPMQYAVWENDGYTALGSHPPFIPIQFALLREENEEPLCEFKINQCDFDNKDIIADDNTGYFEIVNEKPTYREAQQGSPDAGDAEMITYGDLPSNEYLLSEEASMRFFSDAILSELNKAIADKTSNPEKEASFVFPFFVRYAIRLYDGSLSQHSYPVLMTPNTFINCRLTDITGSVWNKKTYITRAKGKCEANVCKLRYWLPNTPAIESWKDLIQGIDIFISAPIYSYDQSGYVKGWGKSSSSYAVSSLSISNRTLGEETQNEEIITSPYQFILPSKETKDINSLVESCSLFYKAHTISFDDITDGEWQSLPIKGSKLATLTSQEVMTDDYNSHNEKQVNTAMIYNSRLNLAGVNEIVTADVPFSCQFAYLDKPANSIYGTITISDNQNTSHKLRNYTESKLNYLPRYFFFPDVKASEIAFVIEKNGIHTIYRIPLKEHSGLNGSVYFRGFGDDMPEIVNSIPTGVDSITLEYPNKIYTSDVDNPFTFRPENINTIGTGNIHALAAATKAISQGQFGAFPLYAFTSEGIWALSVNNSGGWASIQPVSRDVIREGSAPLSIDNAVVFFTPQGLMLLSGGESVCLTKKLNCYSPTPIPSKLPTTLSAQALEHVKFFPVQAPLGYDYAHGRIYVFDKHIAWIYSLNTGTWSHTTCGNNGDYALNEYPGMVIVRQNSNSPQEILSIGDTPTYHEHAEVLTRPITLGSTALRTLRTVITRGLLKDAVIGSLLYGSMNNEDFVAIASSDSEAIRRISGSPYRSHSLFLLAAQAKGNFALTFVEVEATAKYSKKLR